jgi:hypothetical protein
MAIRLTRPNSQDPISERAVLLVDGVNDQRFFGAAASHRGLTSLQIITLQGSASLRAKLRAVINTPGFSNVVKFGIARDADTNPSASFQSACDACRNEGLSVPARPLVAEGGSPGVSIMIIPDINSTGELAHLCLRSISNDQRYSECVIEFMACLDKYQPQLMGNRKAKAELHAYLAGMDNPGLRFGEAAEVGYFPWTSPALAEIFQFLDTLK